MAIPPGTKIGPCDVVAPVGAQPHRGAPLQVAFVSNRNGRDEVWGGNSGEAAVPRQSTYTPLHGAVFCR